MRKNEYLDGQNNFNRHTWNRIDIKMYFKRLSNEPT